MPTPDAWGDFGDQADQLAGFFHDTCKRAFAMPAIKSAPPIWLLSAGSNADSGRLAAEKGMGLAVALFINPDASAEKGSVPDIEINLFPPSSAFI